LLSADNADRDAVPLHRHPTYLRVAVLPHEHRRVGIARDAGCGLADYSATNIVPRTAARDNTPLTSGGFKMARVTLTFEMEMDLDVPDTLAPELSAQDVCDSAAHVAGSHGTGRLVMGNEFVPASFKWVMRPRHSELPFDEAGIYLLPSDNFVRIES
jgi:hypothetical protein